VETRDRALDQAAEWDAKQAEGTGA
jgi:hypothetical protein